ncbi:tetratricopeptide repeat protein [Streptomyces sp. NPDC127092]|uniref:tetratricopeptide repeat protein n=1 Tax=Streptomyces sp. NPDC127092 TaxID=3347135 RepID=UPI00365839CA
MAAQEADALLAAGRYEEAEEKGRALAAVRGRGSERRLLAARWGVSVATEAAIALGRGVEVLEELEALIQETKGLVGWPRQILLAARRSRVTVLVQQGRLDEAEDEARSVLREVARLRHLVRVDAIESGALIGLAVALCERGRYEEAEAVARGNLARMATGWAPPLHTALVHALCGQQRYAEALEEAGRAGRDADPARAEAGELGMAIATALHGLGRHQEAEQEARRAVQDCAEQLHPTHPRQNRACSLLARISGQPLAP